MLWKLPQGPCGGACLVDHRANQKVGHLPVDFDRLTTIAAIARAIPVPAPETTAPDLDWGAVAHETSSPRSGDGTCMIVP